LLDAFHADRGPVQKPREEENWNGGNRKGREGKGDKVRSTGLIIEIHTALEGSYFMRTTLPEG
jgi:hypothetical protein